MSVLRKRRFFLLFFLLFLFFVRGIYSSDGGETEDFWYLKLLYNSESSFYKTSKYKGASIYNLNKGKRALRRKSYSRAIKYFKRFLKQGTPIHDYGLYYLGKAYFMRGEYSRGINYFKELRKKYELSPFLKDAVIYEGRSYISLGRYSTLLKEFRDFSGVVGGSYSYFVAEAHRRLRRYRNAAFNYFEAIRLDGKRWRKKAMNKIAGMRRRLKLSYSRLLSMGINYYYMRHYRKSLSILTSLGSRDGFNYERLYYIGLSSLKLSMVSRARVAFASIMKDFSSDDTKYVSAAYHYFRHKSFGERIKGYRRTVLGYETRKALPLVKELISYYDKSARFKDRGIFLGYLVRYGAYVDLWRYFMKDLNRGNIVYILSVYSDIVSGVGSNWFRSKFYFWLGVVSVSAGKYYEAGDYFRLSYLSYGHSYYSYKSLLYVKRYSGLGKFDISFSDLRRERREREEAFFDTSYYRSSYSASFVPLFYGNVSPYIDRFVYFVRAGFTGYAGRELRRFFSGLSFKERGKYYRAIAYFFHNEGRFKESIDYVNRLVVYLNGSMSRNYIPVDLRGLLFPLKYTRYVDKASKDFGIDSFLLFAVMREESRFNPRARSWAGARGLMQIMPGTGRFLSRSLGFRARGINLYNIGMNVRFGSYYLSGLIDRFDSVSYGLAGYNGGPSRMRRILRRRLRLKNIISVDHVIELIPIRETRNYVKKVLTSYYSYLDFYNQF